MNSRSYNTNADLERLIVTSHAQKSETNAIYYLNIGVFTGKKKKPPAVFDQRL